MIAATSKADVFDLHCAGTTRTRTASIDKTEPFVRHYRIDLVKKQWCEGDCGATYPIAEVQEAFLRLEPNKDETTPRGRKTFMNSISRTDGKQTVFYVSEPPVFMTESDAQCRPSAFSGFPELQKQF